MYLKKIAGFIMISVLLGIFSSLSTGCKKEVIIRENYHDSIIVRHDTIITKYDVQKWMTKKWMFLSHEIETYSGTALISKKHENFASFGYYHEYKTNGASVFFDSGGTTNGTWELLSDNYYVLDKNTVNERYYYITSISEKNLVIRGPFAKNNTIYTNFLYTGYFKGP